MKPFTRKQHYFVLLSLLIITVATRLPFRGPFLYDGDPVAYFSGAEAILETGQYLVDGKIPFWPVGTSLTLIPFIVLFKALGLVTEAAAFWHGLFFIYIAVAITYLLGKRLFSPATGIIAAVLLIVAESPLLHSINAASDTGALAMLLTSVYLMLLFLDTQSPKDLFLSMFFLGFAFVFRWNYVFFLPLFPLFLIGDRRIWAFHLYPSFWLLGFFGFLSGIAIQLAVNYSHYGNPLVIGYSQLDYSEQFIFSPLIWMKNLARVAYRMLFTWDFFSPLLAVFGMFGILELWRARRRDVFWLLFTWVVLGTFSIVYFGVKPRLLIPLMPPAFLIGGEGMVRIFHVLRKTVSPESFSSRLTLTGLIAAAALLFLPMIARSFLHAHGHFQDKVIMQKAFRWASEKSPPGTVIITQPEYTGQNDDWIRAGWQIWASRRYAQRETASLRYPETWPEKQNALIIINRFWFEAENLRYEDTEKLSARFDSLKSAWAMKKIVEYQGASEPKWLKKLNMLSFYPLDFMVFRPRFEIWMPEN